MREGQEKEGRKHGKIKGRGTPSSLNLRFSLSAHGVGVLRCSTVDFSRGVRRFSRKRQFSVILHGTVRETAVICGADHVF
jgi:hypothetical protein